MKSNNPIFNRSEEFSGAGRNAYGNQTYAGAGQPFPGYGQESPYGAPTGYDAPGQTDTRRMTVDSVVQRTAISLFVVVLAAAATWFWTGDAITESGLTNDEA